MCDSFVHDSEVFPIDRPTLPVYDQTDHAIRILEEERRRIARDLHDGPAQILTNISMKLEIMKMMIDTNPDMAKSQVDQLHKRVGAVVNDIRHLIYDLRPIAVDEVGFLEAIEALCIKCENGWGIAIRCEIQEDMKSNSIAPAKQVALYRLVQEVLNNMKKHAKAAHITVRISSEDDQLYINILDDGVGFDPDHIPPGHYGLIGIKERAAFLGGTLVIRSTIGEGSEFMVQVPVYRR